VCSSDPFTEASAWLDALDAACRAQPPTADSDLPLIAQRMQTVSRQAPWREGAARLDLSARSPEQWLGALARAAAERHRRSGNFTVLHLVTGLRAAAVLHARQPLPPSAWPRLRDALAAASLVSDLWREPLPAPPQTQAADWDTLARHARAQEDDHQVKLVHALAWWDAQQPDTLWRQTAAQALQG
jgi:hypothetical protein